ncbi:16S rRNA (guanine(966)-N(2))-methyltransferase RsmD [bacterium]|nr:16S rRNA (guanine(966)-N(2))-methyltransferase RsmD [bacterium]
MLRVISGIARGSKLKNVNLSSTRPIQDRVKESLFNILKDNLEDSLFLDLFAGTGSVGVEALSQGCQKAIFVENNYQAIEVIKFNLKKTNFILKSQVIDQDVFKAIKMLHQQKQVFDFIFVGPPQFKDLLSKTLLSLKEYPLYIPSTTIIIGQAHPKEELKEIPSFRLQEKRRYGNTVLLFYKVDP